MCPNLSDDLFYCIRLLQTLSRGASRWFRGASEGSETLPFFKKFFFAQAPFGPGGLVAECIEPYLYSAVDLRPGPGRSRTTASCQPEARRPRTIPLRSTASIILPFFQESSEMAVLFIRFELYGGSKLDEIGSDDLLGHSKASNIISKGFPRGLKPSFNPRKVYSKPYHSGV